MTPAELAVLVSINLDLVASVAAAPGQGETALAAIFSLRCGILA